MYVNFFKSVCMCDTRFLITICAEYIRISDAKISLT